MEMYLFQKEERYIMAEKKKNQKIVSASSGKQVAAKSAKNATVKKAAPVGNATGLRIGAVILWVVAIGFEVLALLFFKETIKLNFLSPLWLAIIALVLDLICVIIGSLLWKKANDYDPASEKNKLKFWLWNNLGTIVAVFAFLPFIILALTDKKADKKSKTIVTIVAAVALIIAGLVSYDWNPTSQEDLEHYQNYIQGDVYWTKSGTVFHTHVDCQHLGNSAELIQGTVDEAFAANKNRPCKTCLKKDNIPTYEESKAADADPADTTPAE